TLPGHDPSVQLLAPSDLARAIAQIVSKGLHGVFNLTPSGVIPLRTALRLSGAKRVPIPRTVFQAAHRVMGRNAQDDPDYLRYSWTASSDKIEQLDFRPRSSAEALAEFLNRPSARDGVHPQFDDFGLDKRYINLFGRTLFRYLADWYWRIEVAGT